VRSSTWKFEAITFEVDEHVATITLDRPEALNSFNDGLAREMDWARQTIRDTDDITTRLHSAPTRRRSTPSQAASRGARCSIRSSPAR